MKNRISMNGKIVLMSIGIAAVSIIVGMVGIVGLGNIQAKIANKYDFNDIPIVR